MPGINAGTKGIGIIGHPIGHSLSPIMHNAAFKHLKLDICYLAFDVMPGDLGDAVRGLKALGFLGANVTIPYKVEVARYLDELASEASAIGAVNTIVVKPEGLLVGYNTDAAGFLRALKYDADFEARGKRAVILGAGGAARACVYALASGGAREIVILNRTPERAEKLAEDMRRHFSGAPGEEIAFRSGDLSSLPGGPFVEVVAGADLLVNATSLGMWPESDALSPLPESVPLASTTVICDLVYRPVATRFIKFGQSRGARVVSGLSVLLHQGALSFRMWTGVDAPLNVMREALVNAVVGGGSGK
ncbi:MAG TPA: shikimate dehydrogenase [Firmicutes bacterium]|nr:shikimate dehydrogenase [Bacillota bacterium]